MRIELKDKIAIVTGSSSGIGLAIAKGLAGTGATTVINGRKEETLAQAKEEILKEHPEAIIKLHVGDLSTKEGCDALLAAYPSCDVLINNLGIYGPQDFFELEEEVWERFFQVNIMSGVRLSKAYAPGMVDKKWGRIVFISSESGFNIPSDMIHYGFTKTANISIARGLAKRLAGTGVTVNSVLPGPTLSEGLKDMLKDDVANGKTEEEAAKDFVMANRPSSIIQRAATVEEVANMVVYVSSKQASATTGASLRVEGGVVDTL